MKFHLPSRATVICTAVFALSLFLLLSTSPASIVRPAHAGGPCGGGASLCGGGGSGPTYPAISASGLSPTTATVGVPVTLTSTITNIGTAPIFGTYTTLNRDLTTGTVTMSSQTISSYTNDFIVTSSPTWLTVASSTQIPPHVPTNISGCSFTYDSYGILNGFTGCTYSYSPTNSWTDIGTVPGVDMPAGGTAQTTHTYTFNAPGTYYVDIIPDSTGSLVSPQVGYPLGSVASVGDVSFYFPGTATPVGNWTAITVTNPAAPTLTATLIPAQTTINTVVGTPVSLSATIANTGTVPTGVSFPTVFWTNTTQSQSGANAQYTDFTSGAPNGFPANYSETDGPQLPVTRTFNTPGTYYYQVCADQDHAGAHPVSTSNTNYCSGWGTIVVAAASSANLTAGTVSPLTAAAGTPVTFTTTVTNSGTGASGSFPSVIEIPDGSNVVQTNSISLAASGGSAPVSASYTFTTPGSYQVEACANYNAVGKTRGTNIVTESSYADNCGSPVTVVVTATTPTVSCTANPTTISAGGTVTWTATASGGSAPYTYAWGGNVAGSSQTVSQTYPSPGTYSGQVTVTDSKGANATAQCSPGGSSNPITVTTCVPSFWPSPATVVQGNTSQLNWSSNAACNLSCTGQGFTATGGTGNGSAIVTPSTAPTTSYSLMCSGQPNQNASITVIVPTVTLTASPTRVVSGGTTSLTWNSNNTTACTITRNGGGTIGTGVNGSATDPTPITEQTTYTATCAPSGNTQAIVNVAPQYTNF